uniref:Extended synaptotagminlike protein 2a [Tribolium castaneum] n=1 Tax=Lepeophtheirus salmonis TaxID=72036 RepID=A0A0K2UPA4_LEPSM
MSHKDDIRKMKNDLPGSHLNIEEEPEEDSVVRVIARFALRSAAWIGIYFLGYFNFSASFMIAPLILSVLRDQWKKEKRDKLSHARIAALTNEKSMIESRMKLEDLPSWVFFPDRDRAEWLNSIIKQLWPNVGHYTRKLLSESIEPAVATALEAYKLNGFKFDRVVLGQVPPRITGIKVYEKNTARDEIIMDMDIVLASDCEICFSVKKFKARISDFSLRGVIRVVFKPLIADIPLIGGIQVFFLSPPEIDFDLGGIANALDAPGLSNIVRKIILEQVGHLMVLPNKYSMTLVETVKNEALKCPDTAGVLRVNLIKGAQLLKKDIGIMGMGKSDPLAILTVGNKRVTTPMIKNTVNPEWDFIADFPIEVIQGQELLIEVWDHDDPGDNEFLGRASIKADVVAEKGELSNIWVDLEDVSSGKIQLSLSWMEATTDTSFLRGHRDEAISTVLQVYIDSCKGVESVKAKKPCPMVELTAGHETQNTWAQYNTTDPVYEQGFVFLVVNPEADDLKIRVINSEKSSKSEVLGFVTIHLSDLLRRPNLEYRNMPFTLKANCGGNATVLMTAQIRVLREPKPRNEIPPPHKHSTIMAEPKRESVVPQPKKGSPTRSMVSESLEDKMSYQSRDGDDERESYDEVYQESRAFSRDTVPESAKPQLDNRPSLSDVIGGTISASTGNSVDTDLLLSSPSHDNDGLRRRRQEPTCGKIKLSLSYSQRKEKLTVVVHNAYGLPGSDLPDPPDPYVKLYLLPEKNRKSKRKSEVVKDSCNPIYDEEFYYDIPLEKLATTQLEVSVIDKKGIFSKSPLMGRAVVDFVDSNIDVGISEWYPLYEEEDDSD